MSGLRRAKFTLGAAVVFCSLTIWGVHYQQRQERDTMYKGVLRDDERRKEKIEQRQEEFEQSKRKRELYEQSQTVEKAS